MMAAAIDRETDQRLLDATLAYVAGHSDEKFDPFRDAVANWGDEWEGVAPVHMTASDLLVSSVQYANPGTAEHALMELYVQERATRYWEQSYTAADTAVGADMLAGYGYAEIVGKRGPFLSDRIRAGVGVFAANVYYPAHKHLAEEIYVILAGSGTFKLGADAPVRRSVGDVIHITSHLVHGFNMTEEPLVFLYLWQGGDLREKSTFV